MNLSNNMKKIYMPLIGKAKMSKEGIIIEDKKSEEIFDKISNYVSELKPSKWNNLYISLRAIVFDNFCNRFLSENENAIVIHLGCGLDSRALRVKENYYKWYDVDSENIIQIRKKYFEENEKYKMISSSISDNNWIEEIEETDKPVLIIAERVTMYLSNDELHTFVDNVKNKFKHVKFIFDAYSKIVCKISKIKNSVKKQDNIEEVKWGIDTPDEFKNIATGITFNDTYLIYNEEKINSLNGVTKYIFKYVFTGKLTEKLYKIYSFDIVNRNF